MLILIKKKSVQVVQQILNDIKTFYPKFSWLQCIEIQMLFFFL